MPRAHRFRRPLWWRALRAWRRGGAAVEEAVTVSDVVEGRRAAHAMHVALHTTDAPKCGRCWRHVPREAVGAGEGVLMAGGWTYRGCICPPGMHEGGT